MKSTLLTFLFAIGAVAFSFGYPECTVKVKNNTGVPLMVDIRSVINTPNTCPETWTFTPVFYLPVDAEITILLGTAPLPAPAIRPFQVRCWDFPMTTMSWQVNTCWNPSCVFSDEPVFDIQFTYCADDYLTYVDIY